MGLLHKRSSRYGAMVAAVVANAIDGTMSQSCDGGENGSRTYRCLHVAHDCMIMDHDIHQME